MTIAARPSRVNPKVERMHAEVVRPRQSRCTQNVCRFGSWPRLRAAHDARHCAPAHRFGRPVVLISRDGQSLWAARAYHRAEQHVVERLTRPVMSADLLQRARAGDEAALRSLYEEHRPRVLRLAFALLGDADEAEDVMQDVMVYALTHLDRYDPERAAFPTWLHTIVVSRCRDRYRRQAVSLRRIAEWWGERHEPHGAGPDAEIERIDARDQVGRALKRLTPLQREALVLREVEDLTFEEIGRVLGVPLRTAQARVASAHMALRRALPGPAAPDAGSGTG
jgi:RNA polymerase sigma-70 factor, ECF subfamily